MPAGTDMKKNVLLNTAGSVWYSLCQWLMTVLIIHMSTDYRAAGVLGLAMTVTNAFTTLSSFGMRNFQISDVTGRYRDSEYLSSRLVTAAAAYLSCAVYTFCIGCTAEECVCVLIWMLLRLTESVNDVYQGIQQLHDRYDMIGISYFMRGGVQIMLFVAGYLLTKRLDITFAAMFLASLAILLLFDVRKTGRLAGIGAPKLSGRIFSLLKECAGLVVFNFVFGSFATVARVAVRQQLGQEELGVYSTVASPTVVIPLVILVMYTPFIPVIARMYGEEDGAGLKRYMRVTLLIFAAAFAAVTAGGMLLGKPVLGLLYNEGIAARNELLVPLLWSTLLTGAVGFFAAVLIAMRRTVPLVICSVVAFALNYALSQLLVRSAGANGASMAQVISQALLTAALLLFVMSGIRDRSGKDRHGGL